MCSSHIDGAIIRYHNGGDCPLEICHSMPLKSFKREIGQANHMLITIMVGLDGIVPYNIEAKEEFHTSWNPKSKESSVNRSKVFVKKAGLVWLVDCIDMYFRLINQSPTLIESADLKRDIDDKDNSRSVYRRLNLICCHYALHSIDFALVDLLICWRNRLTHFQAENNISAQNRVLLQKSSKEIAQRHCGLDIQQTLISFDRCSSPSFKEVTSFVRASINLISKIDECILDEINQVAYADRILVKYLSDGANEKLNNIFSKDIETAEKTIRQILFQYSFTTGSPNSVDELCKSISVLNFKDAKCKLAQGTFM